MIGPPQDYNLPPDHTEWRDGQEDALEFVLGAKDGVARILEFPTGGGKTSLAAVAGHEDKALALMLTKDLQIQYQEVYGFDVIFGRANYTCVDPKRVKKWMKDYRYPPTVDDCPYSKLSDCPLQCGYKAAKTRAISSNKTVANYHYAWYSEWWHKRGGYLFCDEAHNLATTTISALAQLKVSERQRNLWNLPKFPACSGTTEWAKDKVFEWIDSAILCLYGALESMDEGKKEKSKGTLLYRRFKMLKQLLQGGDWYVEGSNVGSIENPPHLDCRPINPAVFAPRLLGHHDKLILMSATIGDVSVLAAELGLTDYEFRSYPHNIPAEQRPVYLVGDAPAMSYQSKWADYEKQADVIAYICANHPYERVLIHTTRWRHAKDLADRLARKGLQDRVWVPDAKKQTRIQQLAELTNPRHPYRITISPSFWEGVDYREASVAIVAKVPFSDRSDPVVRARLKQTGGGKWDRWVAALKVVQGCGRVVRDAEDYGVSYICDGNWNRVASYAPQWFNVVE